MAMYFRYRNNIIIGQLAFCEIICLLFSKTDCVQYYDIFCRIYRYQNYHPDSKSRTKVFLQGLHSSKLFMETRPLGTQHITVVPLSIKFGFNSIFLISLLIF